MNNCSFIISALISAFLVCSCSQRNRNAVSSLPTIKIAIEGGQGIISKENYIKGSVIFLDSEEEYSIVDSICIPMKIKGRGHNTWNEPKKPYRIKLDRDTALYGMQEDKDWCLLGNYADKSLIRNLVAMEISRICEMSWTPEMRNCELFINDTYQGVYTLCEQKEVSKHKVDIDINAGEVLIGMDTYIDKPVFWSTDYETPVFFIEPKSPNNEQIAFVRTKIDSLEFSLHNNEFDNVYRLIDIKSFINNFIIQELSLNNDAICCYFLTLTKTGKFEDYFVWDFDHSFGNNLVFLPPCINEYQGWLLGNSGFSSHYESWYHCLLMDPIFTNALKQRWRKLYPKLVNIPNYIDYQVDLLGEEVVKRNFSYWEFYDSGYPQFPNKAHTYQEEIQFLKDFYINRLEWMNENIYKL